MVVKLTMYVRNVIFSFYKPTPGEIPLFWTFMAIFSILTYVLLKISYFGVGYVFDVIVTS